MEDALAHLGALTIIFIVIVSLLWISIPFILISINGNIKKNTVQIKKMTELIYTIERQKKDSISEGEFDFLTD